MTVPVHSTKFFLGTITDATQTNLYTVPTGYRAVIKAINVQNTAGTSCFCSMRVDTAAGIFAVTVPAQSGTNGVYQWNGWIVIDAGQVINGHAATGKTLSVSVAGYLYPLSL